MAIPSVVLRWAAFPFVRIVILFIGGVLVAVFQVLPLDHPWSYYALAIGVVIFLVTRWLPVRVVQKWSGTAGLFVIGLAGFVCVRANTDPLQADHLIHLKGVPDYYQARICSYPHEKEKTWRLEAKVEQAHVDGRWLTVSGKIYVFQSREGQPAPFAYGDKLLIQGAPQPVRGPANPGEFNYQRFLSYRNIYHQHHVTARQVMRLGSAPANRFLAFAIRARAWSEAQIDRFITGSREQAVAKALVLGITDGLDNDLTTAYAATGAMHVLAVSGLHVSIIYAILLVALRPLGRMPRGSIVQALIALAVLWLYAAVTGLSPSVLRAVTMFSFVVLARPFGQQTNIFNTLAVAAFCLLLWDPLMIMSVGFQLSFLAVVGIVYLQPLLYRRWEPKLRWVDQIWKISCVSIAAQLATFPLGLLYFHQFPNYFLVSNLVVIPASFVVLVGGLILLATAPVVALGSKVGALLGKLIGLLNEFVLWIESWPFSLSENWYITTWQCWALMAFVSCWILVLQHRSLRWGYVAAALAVVFAIGNWQRFMYEIKNDRFTVYQVNRHTAYDLIVAGVAFQQIDAALLGNQERFRFHLVPNRLRAAVHTTRPLTDYPAAIAQGGIFWTVRKGKIIAQLEGEKFIFPPAAHVDWLLVRGTALRDLAQLPASLSVGYLIFEGSCPPWLIGKLTRQALARGWRTHSISQNAFQIQL